MATALPSLAVQQLREWAHSRAHLPSISPATSDAAADTPVDLRASVAPATLKAWTAKALQTSASQLRLRPIAAVMAAAHNAEHSADDSASVISVARSFGLSTTTGARGDAVSYVLRVPSAVADSASSVGAVASTAPAAAAPLPQLLGVVKVIKSRSVFQQELSALLLVQSLLPHPSHAHYPRLIAADWALIPTTIPTASSSGSSHAAAFARPYSVGSMGSTTAPSSTSSDGLIDANYCKGGLVLMECAPGVPLSELFTRVGAEALASASRDTRMSELLVAIREAARALAELHLHTSVPAASPDVARPFLDDMAAQMRDMMGKLALPEYAHTISKWQIDVARIRTRMEEMLQQAGNEPGVCCLIHGDAHAGNMLWDAAQQRITLVDLPTMLHATRVETREHDADTEAAAACPLGSFRLDSDVVSAVPTPTDAATTSATPAARWSAVCPHPPPGSSLLLSGCALAARDVCHFERKLDSHGTRRGLLDEEVARAQQEFTRAYGEAGGRITDAARQFARLRSLLGDLTQLVKYEPEGLTASLRAQLQRLLDGSDAGAPVRSDPC